MPLSSSSRVLVTGGAGFIGCALAERLAHRVERYVVVDNLHPQVHPEHKRPEALTEAAELIVADAARATTWDNVLPELRPDLVVHLAAETGTGQSLDESSRHATVNVLGTAELMDGFTRSGFMPEHIVLSSSRAVYGEGRWQSAERGIFYPGQRTHEQLAAGQWDFPDARSLPSTAGDTVPHPTSVYGATKLAQEHLLGAWCRARGVNLSVLRLQNVYGPGQSLTNSYTGIVTLFSQLARDGRAIPLYEDGEVTRDFVFISDVAAAFDAVVSRATHDSGPHDSGPFDIGTGRASTIAELAGALAEYHHAPVPVVTGRFRDGDVRHASCDASLAAQELGWSASVDLRSGLAQLQEWISDGESKLRA